MQTVLENTSGSPDGSLPEVTATVQETLANAWESFLGHTPYLAAGLLIACATWIIGKVVCAFVRSGLRRSKFRNSLKDLLVRMVSIAVWVGGLMLAASVVFPVKSNGGVVGMATAASIWNTGAIGMALAYKRYEIAIVLALLNFMTLRFGKTLKHQMGEDERERPE